MSCYALEWSGSLSCPLSLLLMYALCFSLQLFIIADEDFIMVCVAHVLCTMHMLQWTKEALDIAEACTELQQKANYSTQINTETLEEGGQFVMQLQQELELAKATLEEKQACRRELEEKIVCFKSDPTNRENMHHKTEIGSETLSPVTKISDHHPTCYRSCGSKL